MTNERQNYIYVSFFFHLVWNPQCYKRKFFLLYYSYYYDLFLFPFVVKCPISNVLFNNKFRVCIYRAYICLIYMLCILSESFNTNHDSFACVIAEFTQLFTESICFCLHKLPGLQRKVLVDVIFHLPFFFIAFSSAFSAIYENNFPSPTNIYTATNNNIWH